MSPIREIYKPYNFSATEEAEKKALVSKEILNDTLESLQNLNESLQEDVVKMKKIHKKNSESEKDRKMIYICISLFTVMAIGVAFGSKKF